jgi:hypothetical protein
LLLVACEHLKVVQDRLGHHSHSFTSDIYQHVTPGTDDEAAARFDGMAFGVAETRKASEAASETATDNQASTNC